MYDGLAWQFSKRGVPYSFQELLGGDTNLNGNLNRVGKGEMVESASLSIIAITLQFRFRTSSSVPYSCFLF